MRWQKDPSDGRAHLNLAYSLGQTGQARESMAEYRKACDLSPDDPIAFAQFALALAQDGKPEEAIANYRKSWLWMRETRGCRPTSARFWPQAATPPRDSNISKRRSP